VVVFTIVEMRGLSLAQDASAQVPAAKPELFNFVEVENPKPHQITTRKWNWQIKLSPEQSRHRFQIVQETIGQHGRESAFSQVVFSEKALQKSPGDIIHFNLYTGDENPVLNMNKKGNVGLGVSFSRVAGGYGSSNWIVLPGKILNSEVRKQGYFADGELILGSFETVDSNGNNT
jgi:hypothetical protein